MRDAGKILFACGQCTASIRIRADHAGRKGKCPQCREVIRVPSRVGGGEGLRRKLVRLWRGLSLWQKGLWCLLPFALAIGALPFALLALHPRWILFLDTSLVPTLVASALAAPLLRQPRSSADALEARRSLLIALPAAGVLNQLFWRTCPVFIGGEPSLSGDHLHGAVVRFAAAGPLPPALSSFATSFLGCFLLLFAWRLRRPFEQRLAEPSSAPAGA